MRDGDDEDMEYFYLYFNIFSSIVECLGVLFLIN